MNNKNPDELSMGYMTEHQEKRILETYRSGRTHQALKLLMDFMGDPVYGMAIHYTGNEEDAADITQDVFLKCWKKLDTFKGESSLKCWVLTITRNTCFTFFKSRHRIISRDDLDYKETGLSNDGIEGLSPDIRQHIADLQEDLKTPLILYHFMGCRYEEIAHILDIPLNTLKARIRRGRLILAKKLKHGSYHHAV
ncbi:MAG TPA: sigma-70 family RNA polymerase sigma factor [Candidatus Marinimicrobia bacterium]|nr:sigma-70 family RNA polymerase sigma factor [Candidatus Neomarinimicrobiota bacterium]